MKLSLGLTAAIMRDITQALPEPRQYKQWDSCFARSAKAVPGACV
ncbi:hypothetical protein QN382_08235 [Pseudomonas sp. 10B1]|nr:MULTISPECIES: hypothetical protein [unclassified Pseudomonas]MEA9992913.1 hypothetical protein [Pseudomonas sp. AA4]MEB0089088.1 hypothetical protein [Pseudomonas sp. RTI1]MEB0125709.1 hypothetical protein [Pseudomonas sp. CCC1.2]MEB0151498.1 hypothetical protein [Pseudomonas sp. CCC4.3]MEB0220501.1 hypothetical protein [Pseudomonas sp. AB12(2023)]